MKVKRIAVAFVLAGAAVMGAIGPVQAATLSAKDGAHPEATTGTLRPAAIDTCKYGHFYDVLHNPADGYLDNGTLTVGFCASKTTVSQVNECYEKDSGSAVSLRFGWEFTDDQGITQGRHYLDNGAFTAKSGHTYCFAWYYPTPLTRTSPFKSLHGTMYNQATGQKYVTWVVT